jgi:MFS family permease
VELRYLKDGSRVGGEVRAQWIDFPRVLKLMVDRPRLQSHAIQSPGLWSRAFVILIVAAFCQSLSFMMLYPVLPEIVLGMGGNATDIGVVMGAFSLASLVSRPTGGWLSDRFGRRPLLVCGAALSVIASAPTAVVWSIPSLVVLRLLHGSGEAAFYVAAAAAVTDVVPTERRAEGVSLFSLSFFAAFGLGPWLGSVILPRGLDSVVVVAASSSAIALLLMATTSMPTVPRSKELQLSKLIDTSALFIGLLFAITLIGYAGFTGFILVYAEQLALSHGSWLFAVFAGTVAAARLWGGKIPDRFGARPTALAAMLFMALGLGLFGIRPDLPVALVATIILAIGQALCFPALLLLALARGGEENRGAIVGTLVGFLDIGVGVGSLLFGALGAVTGYDIAFLAAAAASMGSAFVLWKARHAS